jgi:hemolysin III
MTVGRPHSTGEEIANAVTHGLGLLASLLGIPVLLRTAAAGNDSALLIATSIFGATLVGLYATSTLYHALPPSRAKRICRVLDHSAIYLLIAGTYTPFAVGVLRGGWGWGLLGVIWVLAVLGIVFKALGGLRFPRLSTVFYLGMGWLAVLVLRPLAAAISLQGLAWVVGGGLLYTVGVLFYVRERPRYSHMVWHLFVLGGSACHFFAVLWYALPGPG